MPTYGFNCLENKKLRTIYEFTFFLVTLQHYYFVTPSPTAISKVALINLQLFISCLVHTLYDSLLSIPSPKCKLGEHGCCLASRTKFSTDLWIWGTSCPVVSITVRRVWALLYVTRLCFLETSLLVFWLPHWVRELFPKVLFLFLSFHLNSM